VSFFYPAALQLEDRKQNRSQRTRFPGEAAFDDGDTERARNDLMSFLRRRFMNLDSHLNQNGRKNAFNFKLLFACSHATEHVRHGNRNVCVPSWKNLLFYCLCLPLYSRETNGKKRALV